MDNDKLHIGTSGWSYKHWHHIFYPDDLTSAKYLEYYITQFDCVELNSSFYHLPLNTTVEGWMRRTPPDFIFCPKLSRYITHQLRLNNAQEALERFFGIFDIMKSRLGPVLIQLPPGLRFEGNKVRSFFNILNQYYGEYRFALEIRHKSWITDEAFKILEENRIAFTIADSGERYPYYETTTTDFVYLRFHGNGQLYASDYNPNELTEYARKIGKWLEEGKQVWVFFNNDIHGYAVQNARSLNERMKVMKE
ncbi:MAG TPA: DUF72 domain-containing protein [Bacteroidales bacterium]|nr:DUF72 domain-containing protein [Bacteroidales bacterium]